MDELSHVLDWVRSATTDSEWTAISAGATTVVRGDRGAIHRAWRRHRPRVFGPLRTNRPSTHYLLGQVLLPFSHYEINDLRVDGQIGHLLVGITNRFDTFFQLERHSARWDRPRDFILHCLCSVASFLDGYNRGPGILKERSTVCLEWAALSRRGVIPETAHVPDSRAARQSLAQYTPGKRHAYELEGEAVPNRPNDWRGQRIAEDPGSEPAALPMRCDTLMPANKSKLRPCLEPSQELN